MNRVQQTLLQFWQNRKTKQTGNGWISGNAVCCTHQGESQDARLRGGVIIDPNGGIAYSCFNCGYRESINSLSLCAICLQGRW